MSVYPLDVHDRVTNRYGSLGAVELTGSMVLDARKYSPKEIKKGTQWLTQGFYGQRAGSVPAYCSLALRLLDTTQLSYIGTSRAWARMPGDKTKHVRESLKALLAMTGDNNGHSVSDYGDGVIRFYLSLTKKHAKAFKQAASAIITEACDNRAARETAISWLVSGEILVYNIVTGEVTRS